MDAAQWARLVEGTGCPMDAPRPPSNDYWDLVAALSISSLYLNKNQAYRGHCMLILDRHAARLDQLSAGEWASYSTDLFAAQNAIMRVARPDHINIETLGNVVPHLHWHIVPRYQTDRRWGAPIWTTPLSDMPDVRLSDAERDALIDDLRRALAP